MDSSTIRDFQGEWPGICYQGGVCGVRVAETSGYGNGMSILSAPFGVFGQLSTYASLELPQTLMRDSRNEVESCKWSR